MALPAAPHASRAAGDPRDAAACFHCGLPVFAPARHRARVLGAERAFCCAGCEAVARTIVAGGFEQYYETRLAPGTAPGSASARPVALPPVEAYDDPLAQRQFVAAPSAAVRDVSLILDRVQCAACLWLNEQWLRRQPGVLSVDINYATQRAQVRWNPVVTKLSAIIEAVRAIGYDAFPFDPARADVAAKRERRRALWRLFVAGFGAMQGMMYAFPAYLDGAGGTLTTEAEQLMRWASMVLTLPVMLFACGPFFGGAWRAAAQRRVSLDLPIAIGLAAGFAASVWSTFTGRGEVYFDSLSMLVFLLLSARWIEASARARATRSLDHLARWMPDFALRLPGPQEGALPERVAAHTLAPGAWVLVAPGARVPADGVVERGASSTDESLLTGEARAVSKSTGDALIGGSVNLDQSLVMRVTQAGASTRAAAVLRLVERAAAGKPVLVEAADRLAARFTLVVLAVAGLAALWWLGEAPARAPWVAIAVLVATCPCALALAAPIVLTRANARLLDGGVALTRGRAIEVIERVTDVVFDKTGTLTRGRFSIVRFVSFGVLDETACRRLACALEGASRHPIARAFDADGVAPAAALRNVPGGGVEGTVQGRRLRLGSAAFCSDLARATAPARAPAAGAGQTPVYLAEDGAWCGAFLLEDTPRTEAAALVSDLVARGLRLHLVSGDHPAVVEALAARLGIDSFTGGATPQDKFDYVSRLQAAGRCVAMIGDGLNDAPVLARADVSMAMGGGVDAAQAQADLVLLGGARARPLAGVARAFVVSRASMRLIRQNLGWALVYNACALPAAAAGWIGPWEAALGMAASSFIVVTNAMRPLDRGAAGVRTPVPVLAPT